MAKIENLYADAGVDIRSESSGMKGFLSLIRDTFSFTKGKQGEVLLDIGYFANVIRLKVGTGEIGIAISADGVGTKVLIAQMMEKYETIGIDCIAMNVNDIVCMGARPISMLNYLAIQKIDEGVIQQIGKGLYEGARQASISIPGGETAQVKDLIKGCEEGRGFDLAGMAVGIVNIDKILTGKGIMPGDIVLGLSSNGIHSNGLSLARHVLLHKAGWGIDKMVTELGMTIGDALLVPTRIYVPFILEVIEHIPGVKALCHITGDGLLNILRVDSNVAFMIDHIPDPPVIFKIIQDYGRISNREMFQVFNMGIGFCIICTPEAFNSIEKISKRYDITVHKIGYAIKSDEKYLEIQPYGLKGVGRTFL